MTDDENEQFIIREKFYGMFKPEKDLTKGIWKEYHDFITETKNDIQIENWITIQKQFVQKRYRSGNFTNFRIYSIDKTHEPLVDESF